MLASLIAMGTARRADGVVLAFDDFESYAAGSNLNGGSGGSGFTGNWGTFGDHTTVQAITLADSNGLSNGGSQAARLQPTTNLGDIGNFLNRALPSTSLDTVYMSFLIRPDSGITSDEFYNFQVSNGATGNNTDALGVGIRNNAGNPFFARVGTSGGNAATNSSTNISLGTDYLLVAKFSKDGGSATYNRTDLFINPLSTAEPVTADATAQSGAPNISSLSLFSVRNFNPDLGDTVYIDNLRFADTFADAIGGTPPPPLPMTTLGAAADAFVQSGTNANSNFGTATTLNIKNEQNNSGNFHRKGYMRFDLTGVNIGGQGGAALQLTNAGFLGVDNGTPDTWTFNLYGLRDDFVPVGGELNENWAETGITWNNAPGNDTSNGSGVDMNDVFGAAPLATFQIIGTGNVNDLIVLNDPAILAFLQSDTDGFATFLLTRETQEFGGQSVVHQFFSRESTAGIGPQLVLTQAPVPEPATLSLLVLGAAGLVRRRRRAA